MRIVAGEHRSRVLEAPKGDAVRPTSDKVRGALFNMLNSRGAVVDALVLDVFCGTGALGLEALSQGARRCAFIDKNKSSLDLAKRNIQTLKETARSQTLLLDGAKLPLRPINIEPATLVFLDPPYGKGLAVAGLKALAENEWLAGDCFCVVEESSAITPPDGFALLQERQYGDTHITLLHYAIQPE